MKKITLLFLLLSSYIFSNINAIVSILPEQTFLKAIGGDKVDIVLMVQPGNSPHTYEPKPSQMVAVSHADIYFAIDVEPYEIKLFVSKEKADIFKRKPLSKSQRILKTYDDGSFDFSIVITHDMEIIPKIQQFMPHLKIIDTDKHSSRILNTILSNLKTFQEEHSN